MLGSHAGNDATEEAPNAKTSSDTLTLPASFLTKSGSFVGPSGSEIDPDLATMKYTGTTNGVTSRTNNPIANTKETNWPWLPLRSKTDRYRATTKATALKKWNIRDCRRSSAAVGGVSRRKKAAMRQTTAGTMAKVSKKAEGSEENRAVQRSVNMAVLRPKYPFKIPETGPCIELREVIEYLPIGEGLNSLANDKPLNAITNEPFDSTYEEYKRGGKTVGGKAGEEAESLADIFGDGEVVELKLGKKHERFKGVGVVGKCVVVASNDLNPDGTNKAYPF
nr:hypothetical protein Iba_chr02eCG2560 [Ipomoea batatas]